MPTDTPSTAALVVSALHDADDVSGRIHAGGYRANLSDTEHLRNHVRRLANRLEALSSPPPDVAELVAEATHWLTVPDASDELGLRVQMDDTTILVAKLRDALADALERVLAQPPVADVDAVAEALGIHKHGTWRSLTSRTQEDLRDSVRFVLALINAPTSRT